MLKTKNENLDLLTSELTLSTSWHFFF